MSGWWDELPKPVVLDSRIQEFPFQRVGQQAQGRSDLEIQVSTLFVHMCH